jgi:hypothetical protein
MSLRSTGESIGRVPMTARRLRYLAGAGLVILLPALSACTYWSDDFRSIVDQSQRDFTFDPDKPYKEVDLADVIATPRSYMLMDIKCKVVLNRLATQVFVPMYSTFLPEDYFAFSAWSANEALWEPAARLRSIPTLYIRKDAPSMQTLVSSKRFAYLQIRGRVLGDYEQIPFVEIYYVDELDPEAYTEYSLGQMKKGLDAVDQKKSDEAIRAFEEAVADGVAPAAEVIARHHLARLYEAKGDLPNAHKQYGTLLLINEHDQVAFDGHERTSKELERRRMAEVEKPK